MIKTQQVAKGGRRKRTDGGGEDEQNRDLKSRWPKNGMVIKMGGREDDCRGGLQTYIDKDDGEDCG